jgi:hypothetical protein
MRTTIRMNDGLRRQMMEMAEKEGRTFTDLVEEAAALLIKQRDQETSRRRRVKLRVFDLEPLIPAGMTIEQWVKELQTQDDADLIRRMMRGDA